MSNMTTNFRPVHYNGKPMRKKFPDGYMGSKINEKTDKEYDDLKNDYESMHSDSSLASFEEYVQMVDLAISQGQKGNNAAPGDGDNDEGFSLSRPASTYAREGSVGYDSQKTIKPRTRTRDGYVGYDSQKTTKPRDRTKATTYINDTNHLEASRHHSKVPKNETSFTSNSTDAATRLLEKLGLEEPSKPSLKKENNTLTKPNLFKIDGDTEGYGLSTRVSKNAATTTKFPSTTTQNHTHKSGSPSLREGSSRHTTSSRSRADSTTTRKPISRPPPIFNANPRLSHLREESSTRYDSFTSDRSTDRSRRGPNYMPSHTREDSRRHISSRPSYSSSRIGDTMPLPNWANAGQIPEAFNGGLSSEREEFHRESSLRSRFDGESRREFY